MLYFTIHIIKFLILHVILGLFRFLDNSAWQQTLLSLLHPVTTLISFNCAYYSSFNTCNNKTFYINCWELIETCVLKLHLKTLMPYHDNNYQAPFSTRERCETEYWKEMYARNFTVWQWKGWHYRPRSKNWQSLLL